MRRRVFGWCVFGATASVTLAIALHAMSASPPVDCAPAVDLPPQPKHLLYVETGNGRLQRALATEYAVTVRSPAEMPTELAQYDRVVLSDVPAHLLDAGRVAVLDAYARGGGSLFIAGGVESFGSGGYDATPLERMLPVRFDHGCRLGMPDLAFVIVANDAVAIPIDVDELMSPNDYVAVIGVDHETVHLRVRPQRAAHRKRIADQLAGRAPAVASGNLTAGLREAYEILDSIHAAHKHVLVIAGAHDTAPEATDLVAAMRDHHITTTVVGEDATFAALGDRLVRGHLATVLPVDIRDSTHGDDDDRVHAQAASAHFADIANAPPLHGYVATRPKPTAEMLMRSDTGEPLLARWHYGAGTVTTWTSDVDGEWSHEWLGWRGYASFWSRVLRGT